MNWSAIVWLVLMIFFICVEASTVVMMSLWFAAGALVAMIASLLGAELWLQVVLFAVVSAVLLALLRPLFQKYMKPKISKTNLDSIIGSTGLVTARIDNVMAQGQVKLGAMEWTARSTSGEAIEEGTLIKVDRIEGVKVLVTPAEVPVNAK